MNKKRGDLVFGAALREQANGSTPQQVADRLGIAVNTYFKMCSGTIRPSRTLGQHILAVYPELYDAMMQMYFGPRPRRSRGAAAIPPTGDVTGALPALVDELKQRHGGSSLTQTAAELGIGMQSWCSLASGKRVPGLEMLTAILQAHPDLYDLVAAVHFGPRP